MFIAVLLMSALLTMPALIGALARSYGFGTHELGVLASLETLAFVVGTFLASDKSIDKLEGWVPVACILVIAANLSCRFLGEVVPLVLLRPLVGLGAGVAYASALKVCSKSVRPDRSFGILTGAMAGMMVFGFQTIAKISALFGGKSVFILYTVLAGFALAASLLGSASVSDTSIEKPVRRRGLPAPFVLLGLAAVALSFLGQGSIWAFLERLGIAHEFSASRVADAMSIFAVMGIIGSLGAAVLPQRVPRVIAIMAALCALLPGLYLLYGPRSFALFAVGCAAAGFYWNFTVSLQLGVLARIDQSGRGAVLGGMVAGIGSGVGPIIAGLLVDGTNFQPAGWLTAALVTCSVACIAVVCQRSVTVQTMRVTPV